MKRPHALAPFFRRTRRVQELARDLQIHLDLETEDQVTRGLSPEEARVAAQRKFGNTTAIQEEIYRMHTLTVLETTWRDLLYALRILRRNPVFTMTAVLTLALGIGANTTVFSLLDAWLFQPLPFRDPDQLVILFRSELKRPTEPAIFPFYRDLEAWQKDKQLFESIAGMFWRTFVATGRNEPEQLRGMIVTDNLFRTLGVAPELGRTFTPRDRHGTPTVVLSHSFWQTRFGASPQVLGQILTLDSIAYQVIGVMPASFDLRMLDSPGDAQLWTLLPPSEPGYQTNGTAPIAGLARLRKDQSVALAQTRLNALQKQVDARFPNPLRGYGVLVAKLQADNTRSVRSTLYLLAAAAAVLLLIICVNLGGLLLGRALQREREMALRLAIGAGHFRLLRQLLTESALLGAAGGTLGLGFAAFSMRLFLATKPFLAAPPQKLALNPRVFFFSLTVTLVATLAFGLIPAFRAASVPLETTLKAGGRGSSASRGSERLRRAFVVGQMALTIVLLLGAALLIQTLLRLRSEPLGFRSEQVIVANLVLPKSATRSQVHAFWEDLAQRVRQFPAVQQAALANEALLDSGPNAGFRLRGEPRDAVKESTPSIRQITISPAYFLTLSIPVLRGRSLEEKDEAASEPVVVVNDLFVKRWLGSRPAIGQYVLINNHLPWRRIVGVVSNTRARFYNTLAWRTDPILYVPESQVSDLALSPVEHNVLVYLRTTVPLSEPEFRRAVLRSNTDTAVVGFKKLKEVVAEATRQPEVRTILLSGFAMVTLLLAGMGLYGVVAQAVTQTTRELGIRAAVGAAPRDLLQLIMKQGVRMAVLGLILGIVGFLALQRVIANFLYGVRSTDPFTVVLIMALFLFVALLASYWPARQVLSLDPNVALREE